MEQTILKAKRRQSKVITVLSVVAVIVLIGLNLLLAYMGIQKTLFVDTTYEGLYTLTDLMKKECAFVDSELEGENKVTITFCSDPDALIDYEITRAVYFMSLQLANTFENIEVKTVNVAYNPTAVSRYKPTSLAEIVSGDVIVSYGERYRVVSSNNFWLAMNDEIIAFNGEYKMASLLKSVTAVDRPTAYYVIGHGETYYDSADPSRQGNVDAAYLQDLLTDRGLATKTLDLTKVDKVPDDCVLLVINNPVSDFKFEGELSSFDYQSETEKIERYLVKNQGAVMVAKDHAVTLPNLEDFLYEWGFDFSTSQVKDGSASDAGEINYDTVFQGKYDTDPDSYGYAIYGDFAGLSSSPSMVFSDAGYITCSYGDAMGTNEPGSFAANKYYAPFFYSSNDAKAYEKDGAGNYTALEKGEGTKDLCAVTSRLHLNDYTGEYTYSYLFCANSKDFFSNEMLGNASFANYEVMSALAENMIRSDEYASIELGSTSANSINQGGKLLYDATLYPTDYYENNVFVAKGLGNGAIVTYTVLIMLVPVIIGAVGIAVRIRRRFL